MTITTRGSGKALAATAAIVVLLAAATPAADAVTFGADLNQPVNLPIITCGAGVLNQSLGYFWPGTGSASCLWSSVAIGSTQALTPPASGTVTTVRVKGGPTTGPMQVDVVRFLYQNTTTPGQPLLACCYLESYGPVFTPQANAITTVPVSLPVKEDATPPPDDTSTIAANDQLALAVLDPNVPVPVFATQGGATDFNVLSYAWYPAPTTATLTAPSPNPIGGFADLTGFQVLMNADLTTDAGAPAGGGGAPAPATGGGAPATGGGAPTGGLIKAPVVGLPRQRIPVKRGTATIPIQCLVVDCTGTLALQNAKAAGAPKAASTARVSKRVTYASTHFSVAAGKTAPVKAKLRASGRKLLKRHRSPKVWANVTFAGGATKSFRVTLIR